MISGALRWCTFLLPDNDGDGLVPGGAEAGRVDAQRAGRVLQQKLEQDDRFKIMIKVLKMINERMILFS